MPQGSRPGGISAAGGACLLAAVLLAGTVLGVSGREWQLSDGEQAAVHLEDGTTVQIQEFPGVSKWAALQHVFSTAEVVVTCPGLKDFSVYVGPSFRALNEAYDRNEKAWCGWERFLGSVSGRDGGAANGGSLPCAAPISPFGTTYVAVAKPPRSKLSQAVAGVLGGPSINGESASGNGHACSMERRAVFSMPRFLSFALGAWLFWSAPALAESTPFRLTGGTLGFMALSAVIVLFMLYRALPYKRSMAVGTALLGSSTLALARYAFGTWLPSLRQLLASPWVLGYLGLSGLLGLAITYYYNDTRNEKATTILRVALQLVGLSLVGLSPSSLEASLALTLGTLGTKAFLLLSSHPTLKQALRSAKAQVAEMQTAATATADAAAGVLSPKADKVHHVEAGRATYENGYQAGAAAAAAAGRARQAALAPVQITPTVPGGAAAQQQQQQQEVSPLVERGLILNEETGHLIGIGKSTYIRLVDAGYVVDRQKGVITPPPGSPSPRRAGARGSGRRR